MAEATAPETPSIEKKEFTLEDVKPHNTAEDCWMVIREGGIRKVYDVTSFLDDHPGGPEIMVDVAGQDATDEFEDIGHSNDARTLLKKYEIGKIKGDVEQEVSKKTGTNSKTSSNGRKDISGQNGPVYVVLAVAVAVGALYLKYR